MSKKKPKYYRVKTYGELRNYRFEEREHGGEIGILKYDNASFSRIQSGYPIVLTFEDGSSDAFELDEVTLVEKP